MADYCTSPPAVSHLGMLEIKAQEKQHEDIWARRRSRHGYPSRPDMSPRNDLQGAREQIQGLAPPLRWEANATNPLVRRQGEF
jgi:hypothetical protein